MGCLKCPSGKLVSTKERLYLFCTKYAEEIADLKPCDKCLRKTYEILKADHSPLVNRKIFDKIRNKESFDTEPKK